VCAEDIERGRLSVFFGGREKGGGMHHATNVPPLSATSFPPHPPQQTHIPGGAMMVFESDGEGEDGGGEL